MISPAEKEHCKTSIIFFMISKKERWCNLNEYNLNTFFISIHIFSSFQYTCISILLEKTLLKPLAAWKNFHDKFSSPYQGMSGRQVIERITEDSKPKDDGIHHHIIHCEFFKAKERNNLKYSNKIPLWIWKKRDELKFEDV